MGYLQLKWGIRKEDLDRRSKKLKIGEKCQAFLLCVFFFFSKYARNYFASEHEVFPLTISISKLSRSSAQRLYYH